MKHFCALGILLLLVGCSPVQTMLGGSDSVGSVTNVQDTPEAITASFLNAWNERDTDTMYRYVSPESRAIYPPDRFTEFYTEVNNQIGLQSLTYSLGEVYVQGMSAAIPYDVTLNTIVFGEIVDEGRTIRLVNSAEGWRVAWSTMDIFEGYTASANIEVSGVAAQRSNIYDRNGLPLVEQNGTVAALYVSKAGMSSENECFGLLADLLYRPRYELVEESLFYNADTVFYVGEIDERFELEFRDQLSELCGISRTNNRVVPYQVRRYDGQGAAVHATGYIGQIPADELDTYLTRGYSRDALVGQAGVEAAYESTLAGRPSRVLRIVEPGGVVLRELDEAEGVPPQPLKLTLDRDLQIATARAVAWAYNAAETNWAAPNISPGAGAVVLDVNSGAVLAMASFPTFQPGIFNPNSLAPDRGQLVADLLGNDRAPLNNRVTFETVAPGSVFKIVTTAAVAELGLFGPSQIFDCTLRWDGSERYGDTFSPRTDWRLTDGLDATGPINISQALTSSCDPFYYEFGARMYREVGPQVIVDYSNQMGLGGTTDLNSVILENPGDVPQPDSVEEAINNAIGQGDTRLSVIKTAKMVAAVANGGTLYEPYIVEQVGGLDGAEISFFAEVQPVGDIGLSEETISIIHQGMCDVITDPDKGTAWWVFNDTDPVAPYNACGKTGTAQAGYAPHAWFVAFAPADNPQVAVVAMAQHSREGSEVTAPMVRRILDAYFGVQSAPWPPFWSTEYVPLAIPDGSTGG